MDAKSLRIRGPGSEVRGPRADDRDPTPDDRDPTSEGELSPSGFEFPGRRTSALGPRLRNFRYSLRFIRPSSHTTIDATVSLPWIVEMSKHSMRRGMDGRFRPARSVSSAS